MLTHYLRIGHVESRTRSYARLTLTLLLAALTAPLSMEQEAPPSNEDVSNLAASLVRAHQNWGPKASTPDSTLTIKESSRSGNVIRFRLYAAGVPKDTIWSLVAWPVTQKSPTAVLQGVTLDDSGLAVCAGTTGTCGSSAKPNDPIDLPMRPVPGEPVRLALVSAGGKVKVFAKTIPVPLRGEDKTCAVEATLLMPGSVLILIDGSGILPEQRHRADILLGDRESKQDGKG